MPSTRGSSLFKTFGGVERGRGARGTRRETEGESTRVGKAEAQAIEAPRNQPGTLASDTRLPEKSAHTESRWSADGPVYEAKERRLQGAWRNINIETPHRDPLAPAASPGPRAISLKQDTNRGNRPRAPTASATSRAPAATAPSAPRKRRETAMVINYPQLPSGAPYKAEYDAHLALMERWKVVGENDAKYGINNYYKNQLGPGHWRIGQIIRAFAVKECDNQNTDFIRGGGIIKVGFSTSYMWKKRPMVVVQVYRYHILALPVVSFGGQGLYDGHERPDEYIALHDLRLILRGESFKTQSQNGTKKPHLITEWMYAGRIIHTSSKWIQSLTPF